MPTLAPEIIFKIGFFPVTNTFLEILLVDVILIGLAYYVSKRVTLIPTNPLASMAEYTIEGFYGLTESINLKAASKIFPYFMSFFLFILIADWSALIPGIGSIGFFHGHEFIPILRGGTSDLNTTLGLALVSLVSTHALSINITGIKDYLGRYFSLNPIMLYVGILELVSEITKVISLSFRLFGNIYAGEVVIGTVSSIFAFVFPLPFMALEIIVGFVQALVFSMLTMAFMAILATPHHEEAHQK
jgi:F-type H+-transporting ATPase subunit a